jgi:hypothetical protein
MGRAISFQCNLQARMRRTAGEPAQERTEPQTNRQGDQQ